MEICNISVLYPFFHSLPCLKFNSSASINFKISPSAIAAFSWRHMWKRVWRSARNYYQNNLLLHSDSFGWCVKERKLYLITFSLTFPYNKILMNFNFPTHEDNQTRGNSCHIHAPSSELFPKAPVLLFHIAVQEEKTLK